MRNAKLITVFPIIAGSGAKYHAMQLAYTYKERNMNEKVAILDFNTKDPFLATILVDGKNNKNRNIDTLAEDIENQEENLIKHFIEVAQELYVLEGTKTWLYEHLSEEVLNQILQFAKQEFDIVFISVSSSLTSLATMLSIYVADILLIIGKQSKSTQDALMVNLEAAYHYLNYERKPNIYFIYNFYNEKDDFHFGELLQTFDLEALAFVAYDEGTVDGKNLVRTKSFFSKPKNKNKASFIEIVKTIEK